jgi:glucose-6-phosphate-specific signal transduction histidine kinase
MNIRKHTEMKQKLTLGIIATLTTPPTIVALWHLLAPRSLCWLTDTQIVACMITMLVWGSLLFIVGTAIEDLFDDEEE